MKKVLQKKLTTYQNLNLGFKNSKLKGRKLSSNTGLLLKSALLALPVVGLVNVANGQSCYTDVVLNNSLVPNNGGSLNGLEIDVNGGGADFRIFEDGPGGQGSLFIKALSPSINLVRTVRTATYSCSSANAANYGASAAINGANVCPSGNRLYLKYGGSSGNWPTTGSTGFVAFKIGSNLGFLELTFSSYIADKFYITVARRGVSNHTSSITANDCATLPVELIHFGLEEKANGFMISWATASEENNAGFELQRSTDGENFQTLDFIEGNGTTLETQEYSYEDKALRQSQEYYYRLKQIDYDGQFEYSEVITARLESTTGQVGHFYPNPSVDGVTQLDYTATTNTELSVMVYNTTGQVLVQETRQINAGGNNLAFDFSTLSTGQYFVKLQAGDDTQYKKLVIQ